MNVTIIIISHDFTVSVGLVCENGRAIIACTHAKHNYVISHREVGAAVTGEMRLKFEAAAGWVLSLL